MCAHMRPHTICLQSFFLHWLNACCSCMHRVLTFCLTTSASQHEEGWSGWLGLYCVSTHLASSCPTVDLLLLLLLENYIVCVAGVSVYM